MKTLDESDVRRMVHRIYTETTKSSALVKDTNWFTKFGEDMFYDMIMQIEDEFLGIAGQSVDLSKCVTYGDIIDKLAGYYNPEWKFELTEKQQEEFEYFPRKMCSELVDLLDNMKGDGSPTAQCYAGRLESTLKKYIEDWYR